MADESYEAQKRNSEYLKGSRRLSSPKEEHVDPDEDSSYRAQKQKAHMLKLMLKALGVTD